MCERQKTRRKEERWKHVKKMKKSVAKAVRQNMVKRIQIR